MTQQLEAQRLVNVGIVAAFATLAFVGTAVIRIPIPGSGGYFNLGDTFVMVATAVVKSIEGAVVGIVGFRSSPFRQVSALVWGVIILVAGYYVFEALVYPALAASIPFFGVTDAKAALVEIVPNLLQGAISAVLAFGIGRVFHRPDGGTV